MKVDDIFDKPDGFKEWWGIVATCPCIFPLFILLGVVCAFRHSMATCDIVDSKYCVGLYVSTPPHPRQRWQLLCTKMGAFGPRTMSLSAWAPGWH